MDLSQSEVHDDNGIHEGNISKEKMICLYKAMVFPAALYNIHITNYSSN